VQFIEGAKKNNHPVSKLEKIWTDWEAFAQYAFNKSHSTCYAYVAFETAYLKAHYPSEYMAAVLNHAGAIEKITFFMEECKNMNIKVLGPDINESQKGFAVNKKGEIRFGFNGMKGVGEAAIENIIEEREKHGTFSSIFDLIKRVNQRTVNKKSLESLAYAGAFDCFNNFHRAQFFFTVPGENMNSLEKIIRFGNQYQAQLNNNSNTLFGDLQMAEVTPPVIPECEPWPLVKLLDFEKEVTGMYMSGHPLDNFKFQIKHYGLTTIAEFNEFKEAITLHPNPARHFRIGGLVTEAQHRISKNGHKYGVFFIEDYTSKMELMLWRDDYVRFNNYLETGMVIYLTGGFRQRFATSPYEFKVNSIMLLESLMRSNTKKIQIEMKAKEVTTDVVDFMQNNVQQFPGTSTLKFCIEDEVSKLKFGMYTLGKGFEMNDEMANFLQEKPEWEVQVELT
ncbi:MAG TPA: OB-fold nucleic acid binding domain-containing protein, partial [Hanamia sp.]|nr:OB-fold nucleic acid binding domain-containing protein [Hanamia sp.]